MSRARPRILILGGYGTFGGRLARLLADEKRLTLIIAGRSQDKAEAFCKTLPEGAERVALALDRGGDIEAAIKTVEADLIVDASGPFQAYGADPYRVVKAALALGIDYMDLADGTDFVEGIARFQDEARARNIFLLSGVSTCPVLTAAVVRRLAEGLARVEAVTAGIAPSPRTNIGLNVIRAIAGYAGKPVRLVRDGKACVGHAFIDSRRRTIALPGRMPMESRRFSLADAPDLRVLPKLWPELRSVWVGAGPVPEIWHRGLSTLAWLVRLRLLRSLSFLVPRFHRVLSREHPGAHRGGMFVTLQGVDAQGRRVERAWHLQAEGDDGPFIPAMPAAAIIRRSLDGMRPAYGARAAAGDVTLAEYDALFAQRAIATGLRECFPDDEWEPLYRRLLGPAYDTLAEPLRLVHEVRKERSVVGSAEIERGTHPLAIAVAELLGFPRAGRNVPVEVTFRQHKRREIWERTFAGRSFRSVQSEGTGRSQHLLCERFGPVTVVMAVIVDEGKLRLVVKRWSILGLSLPLAWAPRGVAYEAVEDGRFNFHVEISHPLTGLIVRYRGWLIPRA